MRRGLLYRAALSGMAMATVDERVAWLKNQVRLAREIEHVYMLSKYVHGYGWTAQSQAMLDGVTGNREYFERRLEEVRCLQSGN